MLPPIKIRAYQSAVLAGLTRLFHDTIHRVNLGDYTQTQVDAWAPAQPDLERWQRKLAAEEVIVAEVDGEIAGYCSWTPAGYIDFLYVYPAWQRRGIASTLYLSAEAALRARNCSCV